MSQYELFRTWPARLQERLAGRELTPNQIGHSGSEVYGVGDYRGEAEAYLKISPSAWDTTLRHDRDALRWLAGKAEVPAILDYEEFGGRDFLLMTAVRGQDASRPEQLAEPDRLVRLYAEGLRRLHGLPIDGCPLDRTLRSKLAEAERRVREGKVDVEDLEGENAGRSPEDIYGQLLATAPEREDLVFAHGDYCLPNVLIDGDRVSGFIDLGRAGVADRYQDVALAIRSLRHNYGSDRYKDAFLSHYGIDAFDEAKANYYILLDELF